MQIDYCLILAAGFGTRMGNIGKKLPKVLWPVFEKPLLGLQVTYAKSLGIKNIYINLHFMSEEILRFTSSDSLFDGVTFLVEKPEILDIGGGIHNLAQRKEVNYCGKLLVLNADQFFYLSKNELESSIKKCPGFNKLLFTYEVDSILGYNALDIDESRKVKRVIPNKELEIQGPIETYTGISLIDLNSLDQSHGSSSFFNTVCDFKKNDVFAFNLKSKDYWDFGTLKRYWTSVHKILDLYLDKPTDPFIRFLIESKALKSWKIDVKRKSYNSSTTRVINLNSEKLIQETSPGIFLRGISTVQLDKPFVFFDGIIDQVD